MTDDIGVAKRSIHCHKCAPRPPLRVFRLERSLGEGEKQRIDGNTGRHLENSLTAATPRFQSELARGLRLADTVHRWPRDENTPNEQTVFAKMGVFRNAIARDRRKRVLFAKHVLERIFYKSVADNMANPVEMRALARRKIEELPRNSSLVRIRDRCKVTGRGGGVLSFFGLSRITFRYDAYLVISSPLKTELGALERWHGEG